MNALKKGYVVSCVTPCFSEDEDVFITNGLISQHAYSIIQANEGYGVILINIKNPWGLFEWTGDWSDGSELWTDEMINKFQPVFDSK